jgi:hypothetical protein
VSSPVVEASLSAGIPALCSVVARRTRNWSMAGERAAWGRSLSRKTGESGAPGEAMAACV